MLTVLKAAAFDVQLDNNVFFGHIPIPIPIPVNGKLFTQTFWLCMYICVGRRKSLQFSLQLLRYTVSPGSFPSDYEIAFNTFGQSSDYKKLTLQHLPHGKQSAQLVALANESYVLQAKFNALRTDVVVWPHFGILRLGLKASNGLKFHYPLVFHF